MAEKKEKQTEAAVAENDVPKLERPAEKYMILVGDGMADYPIEELGGKTALQAARTPYIDLVCRLGEVGLVNTIPEGFEPGSDVANMALMGYDPKKYYTGRGPLEAAAMGVKMNPEDVAFRCNLVTLGFRDGRVYMDDYSAGHITTEEARVLIEDLAPHVNGRSFELVAGVSYRHLLLWKGGPEGLATVPPHDFTGKDVTDAWRIYEEEPVLYEVLIQAINFFRRHPVNIKRQKEGKPPANSLWPWGQGRRPVMATFPQMYDIEGSVVAAVDLIKGLGVWAGLEPIKVEGATGYLDTDYGAKARAAIEEIKKKDLVFVHVEAPDEAGHMGDIKEKIKAIERFDKEVVGPVFEAMKEISSSYRILIVTDHYTPVSVRTHVLGPVPYVIYDSLNPKDNSDATYDEDFAASTGVLLEEGWRIMERFLGMEARYVELDPKKKKQQQQQK